MNTKSSIKIGDEVRCNCAPGCLFWGIVIEINTENDHCKIEIDQETNPEGFDEAGEYIHLPIRTVVLVKSAKIKKVARNVPQI